jgi:hypothetical protein
MYKLIILIATLIFCASCSLNSVNLVDTDTSNSVLSKIANEKGVTLDKVGKIIKIGTVAGLEGKEISAKDIIKVINSIENDINTVKRDNIKLTYLDAVNYINAKLKLFSPKVIAAMEIIQPGTLSGELINVNFEEVDFDIILSFLESEKLIAKLYL